MLLQLLGNLRTKSLNVGKLVSKVVDLSDVFLKRVSKFVVLLLAFLEDLQMASNIRTDKSGQEEMEGGLAGKSGRDRGIGR